MAASRIRPALRRVTANGPPRHPSGMVGKRYLLRIGWMWTAATVLVQAPGGKSNGPRNLLVLTDDGLRVVCPSYPRRLLPPAETARR